MSRIKRVQAVEGYRLRIQFSDGLEGEIDLSDRLFGPIFEPLRNERLFAQVAIDGFGAIAWPNGADLAPDALHASLVSQAQFPDR